MATFQTCGSLSKSLVLSVPWDSCSYICFMASGFDVFFVVSQNLIRLHGLLHRPCPLPGLQYFRCLHIRPNCLTNGEEYFKIYEKKKKRIINDLMEHRIRNYIIKYICFIVTKIRKLINKQFIDQNKSSCIAVICKQWQLGDIYMHCGHFKVGRINDITFLSNYTVISFYSNIRKQ